MRACGRGQVRKGDLFVLDVLLHEMIHARQHAAVLRLLRDEIDALLAPAA
jgi:hypothetical protein